MNGLLVVFLTLTAASALNLGSDRLVTRDLFDTTSDFLEPAYHRVARRQDGLPKPSSSAGLGAPPKLQTSDQELGGANNPSGSGKKDQTASGTKSSDEKNQRKIAELTNRIKDLKARLAKEEAALAKLKNPSSKEGNKPGKEGNNPTKNGVEPKKDPKKPSKSDKPLGTPTTGALPSTESPAPVGGTGPTAPGT